jgi:hypothetical protein
LRHAVEMRHESFRNRECSLLDKVAGKVHQTMTCLLPNACPRLRTTAVTQGSSWSAILFRDNGNRLVNASSISTSKQDQARRRASHQLRMPGTPNSPVIADRDALFSRNTRRGGHPSHLHTLPEIPTDMPKRDLLGDTGGVGQQVSDCGGTQLVFAGDQLVGVKIVVGGRIELDESLLLQLHYGDRGEGLGDGGDSKEVSSARGLFDARSARPCPWKDSNDPLRTTSSAKPGAGWRLRISSTLALVSSLSISTMGRSSLAGGATACVDSYWLAPTLPRWAGTEAIGPCWRIPATARGRVDRRGGRPQ